MRKYISQRTFYDFVYPNNNKAQYDVNDVVQNINSNKITGSISGFTASISGTTLSLSFDYVWNRNDGEVFVNQANRLHLFSIHMMTPSKTYFNPWRLIDYNYVLNTNDETFTGTFNTSVTQAQFGEAFTNGMYYFEIRMIGALENYIITQQYTIGSSPTPGLSPTPTSSPGTSPTPTPSVTATPGTSATPTVTPTTTPTGTPGASTTPTPTVTATRTPTPSPIYYGFPINIGYSTSELACADSSTNITIYGASGGFLSNSVFYTDILLTSPYVGSSFYYQNTATTQYVQIDNSGNNLGGGTC